MSLLQASANDMHQGNTLPLGADMQPSEEQLGALLDGFRWAGDTVPNGLGRHENFVVVAALRGVCAESDSCA